MTSAVREEVEQLHLAAYLDALGLLWCHVGNERKCSPRQGHRLKMLGIKPGVPDVMIYDTPPAVDSAHGCAIELKATGKRATVSEHQAWWVEQLGRRGWCVRVCYGFDQAREYLRELGYERRA
jgi:hypothetical protein